MSKNKSNFQTKLEYFTVRGVVGAFGLLPLRFSMNLGAWFGRVFQRFAPKLNRVGRRNLELALPDSGEIERRKILRGVFESLGRQMGFVSHFSRLASGNLSEIVDVQGIEHCAAASAAGRGVIIFTAHFGGWEASHLAVSAAGFPVNVIVRKIDNPLVENYVDNLRNRFGSRTIDKKTSAREMFRRLRAGEILGILTDLNTQEHEGVFVDFFGVPASTTTSIAKLALKTNAAVLPAFAVWEEAKGKYVVYLEPPIEYRKTANADEDVKNLTRDITSVVEKYVRKYPEQWLWIHKRWNTRPKGEKQLY